ncbi:MAG: right-handed parallel beta-helix repeat-containing protein, partial [Armatimonadota bacterium]
ALVLSEITLRNNRIWGASGSGIAADVTATATGAQAPLQILGLRIVENEIIDCVERAATWAPGSPPFGGIVLSTVHHLVIAHNRIEDNGHEATVPVCGIYVARSRGFEAHGNQVLNNGPQAISASIPGPHGGIVLPDASVRVNLLPSAGPGGVPIAQPDGTAAALISGNTIVAGRGLALLIKGMGPMLVEGNRLTSRDVIGRRAPGGPAAIEDLVGAALILNLGLPAYFFAALAALGFNAIVTGVSLGAVGAGDQRVVGGKVQFVDNTVTLDLTTGQVESVLADVIVFSMDDINASGTQTECVLPNDILLIDLLVMGITARAIGNGLTETPNRCGFSLLSQTAVMNTGADNQGTHCIRVTGPAGRTVDRDNLIVVPNAQLCPHG